MGMSTVCIDTNEIRKLSGEITETSDWDLIKFIGFEDFPLITVNRSSNPTKWEKSDNGKYIATYGDSFAVFENVS